MTFQKRLVIPSQATNSCWNSSRFTPAMQLAEDSKQSLHIAFYKKWKHLSDTAFININHPTILSSGFKKQAEDCLSPYHARQVRSNLRTNDHGGIGFPSD